MAGEGSRFKRIGYNLPKHLISVKGRTLFEWSMESLRNFFHCQFVFIARKEHDKGQIEALCDKLGIHQRIIKQLTGLTAGQADSALAAEEFITDPTAAVIFYNIDTFVEPVELRPEDIKGDGWIPAFKVAGDRWSFVQFGADQRITKITEKVRISEYGTVGLYYWGSFELFKSCYQRHQFEHGKERYIAPIYEELIADPARSVFAKVLDPGRVHVLGTPEDVRVFWPEFGA